jgi:hypothetical protein
MRVEINGRHIGVIASYLGMEYPSASQIHLGMEKILSTCSTASWRTEPSGETVIVVKGGLLVEAILYQIKKSNIQISVAEHFCTLVILSASLPASAFVIRSVSGERMSNSEFRKLRNLTEEERTEENYKLIDRMREFKKTIPGA